MAAADQTEPAVVVAVVVATLGVPVEADLIPVGEVVDRITVARSSLTKLVLTPVLVTLSSNFSTSDSSKVEFFTFEFSNETSRAFFSCFDFLEITNDSPHLKIVLRQRMFLIILKL